MIIVGIFKKNHKVMDERIDNIRNKIYKEVHYLVMLICLVSIGIKGYNNGFEANHYILELVLLFAGGVYFLIRSMYLGIFNDEVEIHDRHSKYSMSTKTAFYSIGLAFAMALFMGINSAISYATNTGQGVWYFVLVLFTSLMIYVPLFLILFGGIYIFGKKLNHNKE